MKRYRLLIYFIFTFIAGITFTALAFSGQWDLLVSGFQSIKWWTHILIIIASFYITLFVHEITHFITFKINHVKLRALYLTIFIFYKTDKGWRFTVDLNLWVLFGGLVVPDLELVDSDQSYEKTINAFKNSLIAAPYATIIFAILIFILNALIISFGNASIFMTLFLLFTIFSILISIVYIRSFSKSTQNIFGDFVAYEKIKNDKIFQLAQIIQYQKFSLSEQPYNKYLFNRSIDILKEQKAISHQLLLIIILIHYLEGINYDQMNIDEDVSIIIKNLTAKSLRKDEYGLLLSYELAIYHYHNQNVERSYQIYNQIQSIKYKNIDEKLLTYVKKRFEHITHLEYHDEFKNHKENIYTDFLWIFNKIIDPFYDVDKKWTKQLFVPYMTLVNMREDELERDML